MKMKLSSLLTEEAANLLSRPALAIVTASALMAIAVGALTFGSFERSSISLRQDELIGRGYNVWIVASPDGLSAAECERLNANDAVRSSGAVVGNVTASVGSPIPSELSLVRGTPGLPAIFWPDGANEPGTLMLGSSAALEISANSGNSASVDASGVVTSAVVLVEPDSSRSPEFDQLGMLISPASGAARECWVEALPGARSTVEALLVGWFDSADVIIEPFFSAPEIGRLPVVEFQQRISIYTGPLAALALALVMAAYWRIRSLDYALYASMGVGASGVLILVLQSWVFFTVPATGFALLVSSIAVAIGESPLSSEAVFLSFDYATLLAGSSTAVPVGLWLHRPTTAWMRLKGE